MTRNEPTITLSIHIVGSAKKKLKQDARDAGIPMNRYAEQLFFGLRTSPKESTPNITKKNKEGEIELPGGGTFKPAEGYEHLRVRIPEEDL